MSKKKSDDQKIGLVVPFGLRMLPDLRAKVEAAAAKSGRSLNAEITSRLEFSLGMHPYDKVMRVLLDLTEDLMAGQNFVDIPDELFGEIAALAEQQGVPPQRFINTLISFAIENMQSKTPLGKKIIAKLSDLTDEDKS